MRIYNSTYTNSFNKSFNKSFSNSYSNVSSSSLSNSNTKNNLTSSCPALPSVVKRGSITLVPSSDDQENLENSSSEFIENSLPSTAPSLQKGLSYRTLEPTFGDPIPGGGASHLVYEPDSSGRLVEHYSTHELQGLATVGRWTAGSGKKIPGFKYKRNVGRNVLIGNCSAGVAGRKNYCNGFCQFVKSAKLLNGDVTLYDIPEGFKGMPVDVYLYYGDNHPGNQTVKLLPGEPYTTENVLAVGCVPKNTSFYESNERVDLLKWLHDAQSHGYSIKC